MCCAFREVRKEDSALSKLIVLLALTSRLRVVVRAAVIEAIYTIRRGAIVIIMRVVEAIGIAICAVISIDTILLPICTSGCVICISSVGIILSVTIRPVGRRIKRLWEEGIAIGRIVECRVRYCTTILLCARVVVYQNLQSSVSREQ